MLRKQSSAWKSINSHVRPLALDQNVVIQTHKQATADCCHKVFPLLSQHTAEALCLQTVKLRFLWLFRSSTCFLWHLQLNAIAQFVFHKDYVVWGSADALMRPYLCPSNPPPLPSCSAVCQPPLCLFMAFTESLYCAQWGLNLYN